MRYYDGYFYGWLNQKRRAEKLEKENEKTSQAKIAFECPKCHWILRHAKPDDTHPIPSIAKPREDGAHGYVIIRNHICRNPQCKETFAVHWFEPRDFYIRI